MPAPWAVQSEASPPVAGPPWLGHLLLRTQIDLQWLFVGGAMLAVGGIFFGWRALLSVLIATAGTLVSYLLLRVALILVRPQRPSDSLLHALTMGLLVGLALPVIPDATIPLLGGLLLGMLLHLVGRVRRVRVHAVALVVLTVWFLPGLFDLSLLSSRRTTLDPLDAVLRPARVVVGDVRQAGEGPSHEPWWLWVAPGGAPDAYRRHSPAALVLKERRTMLEEPWLVNMLTSGELARLEELLLGSVPDAVGGSSRALVIVLGLYLMYRRLSWWPMAAAALAGALGTLVAMPVIVATASGTQTVAVGLLLIARGPAIASTYLAYMLLATPLPLIVLILAPLTAPRSFWGRVVYGLIAGGAAMAAMWFLALPVTAHLGLVLASLLSRPLDFLHRSPFVARVPSSGFRVPSSRGTRNSEPRTRN